MVSSPREIASVLFLAPYYCILTTGIGGQGMAAEGEDLGPVAAPANERLKLESPLVQLV